jgi:hypothetical protein
MKDWKYGDVIRCDPAHWNDERRWMIVGYDPDNDIYSTIYLATSPFGEGTIGGLIHWSGMILADGFVRVGD